MDSRAFTDEETERLNRFMAITFEFDEELMNAVDHQIPMTQSLFDRCMNQCMKLGAEADDIFSELIKEYPEFREHYFNQLEENLEAQFPNMNDLSK